MRRTIIGLIVTCALGCLCVAPLAAIAQPPTRVHRIGVLTRCPFHKSYASIFGARQCVK